MEPFISVITIIISILALFLSFMNYINARNNVISEVVAQNRIKWISDVRSLMSDFLENYLCGNKQNELKIIKSKIDLYILYDKKRYKAFESKLNDCIQNEFSEKDYRELVAEAQTVLNNVWIRVKSETGITQRDEKKIHRILKRKSKKR